MSTLQIVGVVLGSGALFTFLGVLATLYFTRKKTGAEAMKFEADAHHTEAETASVYAQQVQGSLDKLVEWMPRFEAASLAHAKCVEEKAEALAENISLKAEIETKKQAAEAANRDAEQLRRERDELKWKYEGAGAAG